MTNSQRLAKVRACLTRWLSRNRPPEGDTAAGPGHGPKRSAPFAESILIRDGFYCGRRFEAGSHRAVWFLEEDELKIFTATGQLAEVLAGSAITEWAEAPEETTLPLEASPAAGDDASGVEPPDVLPLPQAPARNAPHRRAA